MTTLTHVVPISPHTVIHEQRINFHVRNKPKKNPTTFIGQNIARVSWYRGPTNTFASPGFLCPAYGNENKSQKADANNG